MRLPFVNTKKKRCPSRRATSGVDESPRLRAASLVSKSLMPVWLIFTWFPLPSRDSGARRLLGSRLVGSRRGHVLQSLESSFEVLFFVFVFWKSLSPNPATLAGDLLASFNDSHFDVEL